MHGKEEPVNIDFAIKPQGYAISSGFKTVVLKVKILGFKLLNTSLLYTMGSHDSLSVSILTFFPWSYPILIEF